MQALFIELLQVRGDAIVRCDGLGHAAWASEHPVFFGAEVTQEMAGKSMRFITDTTLGSLARWLRILGYDTRYDSSLDRFQLMRIARSENRVVLTRDTELASHKGAEILLVASRLLDDQLNEVFTAMALLPDGPTSRCPMCNDVLEEIPKGRAWGYVPSYVFATQERFAVCPTCDRFYWRGTHWERMRGRFSNLRRRR